LRLLHEFGHHAAALQLLACRLIQVGGEVINIGQNASTEGAAEEDEGVDDSVEKVVNIVSAFRLQQTSYDKASYTAAFKVYMKRVADYLAQHKPERAGPFKAAAQVFVKKILGRFDDLNIYTGESYDSEAMLVLSYYKDGRTAPTFWFVKDGLKEIKC